MANPTVPVWWAAASRCLSDSSSCGLCGRGCGNRRRPSRSHTQALSGARGSANPHPSVQPPASLLSVETHSRARPPGQGLGSEGDAGTEVMFRPPFVFSLYFELFFKNLSCKKEQEGTRGAPSFEIMERAVTTSCSPRRQERLQLQLQETRPHRGAVSALGP